MINVGDAVDLYDQRFGWRGMYVVVKLVDDNKAQIRNNGTNSRQTVSIKRLRRSRLPRFFIKSLQGKL